MIKTLYILLLLFFKLHSSELTEFRKEEIKRETQIIEPFFDKEFYIKNYGDTDNPIQDFLMMDFSLDNWSNHKDPNDWFNTTVYMKTIPCLRNPFVDYIIGPKLTVLDTAEMITIYSKKDELFRAWLAIESLIRINKYRLTLLVPDGLNLKIFQCQVNRGLKIEVNTNNYSFYQSSFLKYNFAQTDYPLIIPNTCQSVPIVKISTNQISALLYNGYHRKCFDNYIDPLIINFYHYSDEPLIYSYCIYPNLKSNKSFSFFIERIQIAFDKIFFFWEIGTNTKIIPGHMHSWLPSREPPTQKEFSLSFLFSSAGRTLDHLMSGLSGELYEERHKAFLLEKKINIPTRFYVSNRDAHIYPIEYQEKKMPTAEKKWIFDSQFNVAIENCIQNNYFSEKIIDCFITLTIPIYQGCPNISDYFDLRGMFIALNHEDILNIVSTITKDTYQEMLPFLQENRKKALYYIDLRDKYIRDFLNEKKLH